jgi:hypothetical protein
MSIPPMAARSKPIGHQEFRLLCKLALGCTIIPEDHVGCPCPKCSKPLDAYGDHLVSCNSNGITQRHILIQDKLMDIIRRAGYTPSTRYDWVTTARPRKRRPRHSKRRGKRRTKSMLRPVTELDGNSSPW